MICLRPLIALICIAMVLQACKGTGNNGSTDTITQNDSMKAVKDTAQVNVPLTKEDIQFTINVASSGLKEIELGKLAQQKAQNKRVKNFGGLMAKDITKTLNKLKIIAENKHITLPTAPLPVDRKTIDSLNQLSGKDFDNAYVNTMITGRRRYVTIFEGVAKNSLDPQIKSFANKTLTPIKNHLDAITTISGSMR
jgi:putative membrane protein